LEPDKINAMKNSIFLLFQCIFLSYSFILIIFNSANRRKYYSLFLVLSLLIVSCKTSDKTSSQSQLEGKVPVSITHPLLSSLSDEVELNATSMFLLKTSVKSNVTGYLQEVNAQLGEKVEKGKKLFVIRSKEAANLGSSATLPDTFRLNGLVSIAVAGSGYISQLNYQTGDYVQDGETLATISNANSLVFMLELPYELNLFLAENRTVKLTLPDGQQLTGAVNRAMPVADPVSQTQSYLIKVSQSSMIPENLIARVSFIKSRKASAISLPKEAILTNETQSEYWIMKMIDSIRAVKVLVNVGIETSDRIEILSPKLNPEDNILLTGNYGLPDTAMVSVVKGQQ
jgi:multidrug efflux pump subunit AcrA (membrane-fusion protein)